MRWFKHDSTAHRDSKIKKLKRKYGIVGYGLYWYCLELIAGHVEKSNVSFELEDDSEEIAHEWGLDRVTVSEIMGYMVELELFECNDYRITCLKMANRLDDTNSRHPAIQAILASQREEKAALNATTSEDFRRLPKDSEDGSARLDKIRLEELKEVPEKKPKQRKSLPLEYREMVCRVHEQVLPELCSVRKWDNKQKRAKYLLDIYQDKDAETDNEEFWIAYFEHVRTEDWWMGRKLDSSGQPFYASFEFLVHPTRYVRIIEACLNKEKGRSV